MKCLCYDPQKKGVSAHKEKIDFLVVLSRSKLGLRRTKIRLLRTKTVLNCKKNSVKINAKA
jgi:hypothetical protein